MIEHAKRELELLKKYNEVPNSKYDEWIDKNILQLIKVFAGQGHSGVSAEIVLDAFYRLAKRETLTPITNNPEEWCNVSGTMGAPYWQNNRDSRMLSRDGGQTWYNVYE